MYKEKKEDINSLTQNIDYVFCYACASIRTHKVVSLWQLGGCVCVWKSNACKAYYSFLNHLHTDYLHLDLLHSNSECVYN